MLTFEPAKLQGENWGFVFNKRGHILGLKEALIINFSVYSVAVRSLVAPTVYLIAPSFSFVVDRGPCLHLSSLP